MAALAKAGNAPSVPPAANTETEANPLIPPPKFLWTCTHCLTSMMPISIPAHIESRRHLAALAEASNAQSLPTTSAPEAEAIPPSSPDTSNWTCTICLITMSSNDSTNHKKGKRHMDALAKSGNAQPGPSPTPNPQTSPPNPEPSTPLAAVTMGRAKTSNFPRSLAKAQKNKAHTTAKSGKTAQGIVPPRMHSLYAAEWQRNEERSEYFNYSTPCNTYIDNLDYSICDDDCGWCGECNDNAYVSKSLLYLTCFN